MNSTRLGTSLRDLVTVLFKRKWAILTIFSVTVFLSAAYLFLIRGEMYETTAKLLVKLGQEQAPPSTMLGGRPMTVAQRYQDVKSEVDILQNTELLGQVVDMLELDKPGPAPPRPEGRFARLRYDARRTVQGAKDWANEMLIGVGIRERLTPREQALATLVRGMVVTAQNDSNVVTATLRMPMRRGLSIVLNKLLERYLKFRQEIHRDARAVGFFTDQTQQALKKLQAAQKALHEFEVVSNISALAQQKTVLLNQSAETATAMRQAEIAMDEAASKVARLEKELVKDEPDFAALGEFKVSSFPEVLQRDLAKLQRERERLRMVELDDGARIQNNRAQFKTLMGLVASHLRSVLPEKQAARNSYKQTLESIEASLKALHAREATWETLKRGVRVAERGYLFHQEKLQESLAVSALQQQNVGNVAVIQPAMDPLGPVGTRKATLLAVAIVFGLLAALAYAAVGEFFDHRIFTAEELQRRLKAPVAAVVPVGRCVRFWR